MRNAAKQIGRAVALVAALPALASFHIRAIFMGADRALEGSTQALALIPGVGGQYVRRAFLSRTIALCHPTATVSFGTVFSQTGASIDAYTYIGASCHLGLVHLGRNVLLGSGVHITSGRHTHGTGDTLLLEREQSSQRSPVRIGDGTWIGNAAVVMADVGANSVVGAGAVVSAALPSDVVAAGVPARVIRQRDRTAEG